MISAPPVSLANNIVVSHTVGISVSKDASAIVSYGLYHNNALDIGGSGVYTHTNPMAGPPAFVDPAAGNYRIQLTSAARDAGDPAGAPPAPDHDADGARRPFGRRVDIGAYERRGTQGFLPMVVVQAAPDEWAGLSATTRVAHRRW